MVIVSDEGFKQCGSSETFDVLHDGELMGTNVQIQYSYFRFMGESTVVIDVSFCAEERGIDNATSIRRCGVCVCGCVCVFGSEVPRQRHP